MAIFNNIDELRSTVKISASVPFQVVEPFISSARDLYLVRYLGIDLVEILESETVPERAVELLRLVRSCMGPLSIWLGGAELSVRISDSGITVEKNQDKFLPASDTKISNVSDSLERRGWQYMDAAISHIWNNIDQFPEWVDTSYYRLRKSNYLNTPEDFQVKGGVDISYSWLTFESFRPTMTIVEERFISDLIGFELDSTLRKVCLNEISGTEVHHQMIAIIRKIVACKTAELYTSVAAKNNRQGLPAEYKPVIRPAYTDTSNTGNWYADQASYQLEKLKQTLNKNAVELGIAPVIEAPEFNDAERKIYFGG